MLQEMKSTKLNIRRSRILTNSYHCKNYHQTPERYKTGSIRCALYEVSCNRNNRKRYRGVLTVYSQSSEGNVEWLHKNCFVSLRVNSLSIWGSVDICQRFPTIGLRKKYREIKNLNNKMMKYIFLIETCSTTNFLSSILRCLTV